MDAVDRYQYLLEFVFGARVWRRPRRLFVALVPTVLVFAVWDVLAIARDHWSSPPRVAMRDRYSRRPASCGWPVTQGRRR
jgi:hypothetical protein